MSTIRKILQPAPATRFRHAASGIVILLLASAACIFIAPVFMPAGYSWLSHAISESAAQGLSFAWVARLGFVLFGLGVLWLALYRRGIWARGVYWMQLTFAGFMLTTAAFSHKPWLAGVAPDPIEDLLHSVTASGMGIAFALGVLLRMLQRPKHDRRVKFYDLVALLAATVLTPLGNAAPAAAGLLQRVMFTVAYCWFIHEAVYRDPKTTDN